MRLKGLLSPLKKKYFSVNVTHIYRICIRLKLRDPIPVFAEILPTCYILGSHSILHFFISVVNQRKIHQLLVGATTPDLSPQLQTFDTFANFLELSYLELRHNVQHCMGIAISIDLQETRYYMYIHSIFAPAPEAKFREQRSVGRFNVYKLCPKSCNSFQWPHLRAKLFSQIRQ